MMNRLLPGLAAVLLCTLMAQDTNQQQPPPPGTISGTVTAAGTGTPMKDATVFARRGAQDERSAVTDQSGHFMLRDVAPGNVRVAAFAADPSGRSGFGPGDSRMIRLAPAQDLSGVDFKLTIYGQIWGKVVDQNKEPVVGITVFLVAREYSYGALRSVFAGAGTSDDEGQYRIQRVQPGRSYAVLAQKRWRTLAGLSDSPEEPALRLPSVYPTYHPNSRTVDGADLIVLRPGEIRENTDIQLVRGPSYCLDATLSGDSGGGRGVRFEIAETQPHSGRSGTGGFYTAAPGGTSGPDGKVRICDLHPGDYELSVSQFNTAGFGLADFASAVVTIGDRDVAGVRLAMHGKLPVAGEVAFAGGSPGQPLDGKLRLHLETIARTERADVQSDLPGEFTFQGGVVPDEYGLDISGTPAGTYVKDVTYGNHSILYGTLRVGAAMGNPSLRVTLARDGGTVTARVTDKDGNPVANCAVVVMPVTAPSEAVFAAMLKTGRTDQSGVWTSAAMEPGKYLALATNDNIDRSPECISRLWKARNRGEEIEVAANGAPSLTLSPKPLD
jgi:hypothetical protein